MGTARFTGFGPGLYDFFDGLAANNDRDWFAAHRDTYVAEVKVPLEELLDNLEDEFGAAKIFRINRDVRFSADKSPYKTTQAGMINRGASGTLYLQVNAEGLMAGAGAPHLDAGQLSRWRDAIAGPPGEAFAAIVADLARSSIVVGTLGEGGVVPDGDLKRVPAPYPKDHPRADWLRLKRVVAARSWTRPRWLTTAKAVDHVRSTWHEMAPLSDWLATHVGDAEPGGRGFRR